MEQQSDTQLTWKMDSLGVSGVESATLAFRARHRGVTGGVKQVNQSIQYSDAQGNLVTRSRGMLDYDTLVKGIGMITE